MRARSLAVLVLIVGTGSAAADVSVRIAGGLVEVRAKSAPLAEILDTLARHTGMKVVYDGPPPRQPLTVTLQGYTPAEAVLSLLDGLGLNFALVMDSSGTRVEQLLMAGVSPVSASRGSLPPAPPLRPPVFQEPAVPEDMPFEPEEPFIEEEPMDMPQPEEGMPFPQEAPPFNPGFPAGLPQPPPGSPGMGIGPLTMPTPPPDDEPVPNPVPTARPPS